MTISKVPMLLAVLVLVNSLTLTQAAFASPSTQQVDEAFSVRNATCETDRTLFPSEPVLTGDDIKELQDRLIELGYYSGPSNGRYDLATQNAVKNIQRAFGMKPTGVTGPEVWFAMGGDESRPAASKVAKLPPPPAPVSIVIDVDRAALTVYSKGKPYHTFPIAVGKAETPSPVGEWTITNKSTHWGGGFGTRWMGLNVPWGIYGIHGTNKPWSIGARASHGCFRMFNEHVEVLYTWIPHGTKVESVSRYRSQALTKQYRKGTSGQEVVYLQLALRRAGFDPGRADGRFGGKGAEAVKRLHAWYGLSSDGVATFDTLCLLRQNNPHLPKVSFAPGKESEH